MIQVTNIHKAFGGNQVLKGIDLTIEKGKVVVILGPSGSGKTTFLRCLNALEIPDQGIIAFEIGVRVNVGMYYHVYMVHGKQVA